MKSFKQFSEAYTDRFAQQGTEDGTHAYFNVEDPVAMQKLNAYVGSVADKEYLQPDAAMHQLAMRLGTVGLSYTLPKIEGNNGKTVVELTQFGGRYPQHGRAFLTTGFVAVAFEGGRRGLLCSRAFLYFLFFTLSYRLRTCVGLILRNLIFLGSVDFFAAWLLCFLFLGCSVAGGI